MSTTATDASALLTALYHLRNADKALGRAHASQHARRQLADLMRRVQGEYRKQTDHWD